MPSTTAQDARRELANSLENRMADIMRIFAVGYNWEPYSHRLAQSVLDNRDLILAALRAEPACGAEEMETELRPFRNGEGEGLDEIVVTDAAFVHAETMSDTSLFIGISDKAGGLLHVWVNAVRRKGRLALVMTASDEGDRDTIRAIPLPQESQGESDG